MAKSLRVNALLLFFLLGLFSQAVNAVTITELPHQGTDVGNIDLFVTEANMQGNPSNEVAWVNQVLGTTDASFAVKTETVDYFATDVANVFAFELQSTGPGYFIVKNAQRIALFQNVMAFDWGVFDASVLSDAINLPSDDLQISHVTEINGVRVSVPEPTTLTLLALGLIGASLGRKLKLR